MQEFVIQLIEILRQLNIKPVVYGSFGVSQYIGNFKDFDEVDLLIPDEFVKERWGEFKILLESNGFTLVNEKEHEFKKEEKKVGFASVNILIADNILTDPSELIEHKNYDAHTLSPEDFLKAYEFSVKDGYRVEKRGKKDQDIIAKLKSYLQSQ